MYNEQYKARRKLTIVCQKAISLLKHDCQHLPKEIFCECPDLARCSLIFWLVSLEKQGNDYDN